MSMKLAYDIAVCLAGVPAVLKLMEVLHVSVVQ